MRATKGFQAKMTPMRITKTPAEAKSTVLLRAPPLELPEVPGLVVGGMEEEVDDEREVGVGVGVEVGGFVVEVVVIGVVVEVFGREDVEFKEEREEERGRLTELVEFRQVVASRRLVY